MTHESVYRIINLMGTLKEHLEGLGPRRFRVDSQPEKMTPFAMMTTTGCYMLRRSAAVLTALSLVLQADSLQAQQIPAQRQSASPEISPFEVSIPETLGVIREKFEGPRKQTVFIIQDAHAVPDAQRNIRRLIDFSHEKFGVRLVALEGAASDLDASFFRSFPDKQLLERSFDRYLAQGEVTGGTLSAVLGSADVTYYGIEDWDLYQRGVRHFLDAAAEEDSLASELAVLDRQLTEEKEKIYSSELIQVDREWRAFQKNDANLLDVLKVMSGIQPPDPGSELALLLSESEEDRDRDDGKRSVSRSVEIRRVAALIHRAIQSPAASPELRSESRKFNEQFQAFQTSQISDEAFALFLREIAERNLIAVRVSSSLHESTSRQKRMRDIEGSAIFEELERYADSVKEMLLRNDAQRLLNRRSGLLDSIGKLSKLELHRKDWESLKALRARMDAWPMRGHGIDERGKIEEVLEGMRPQMDFYENAERRDRVFVERTESLLKRQGVASAILVAGGFHAEGLTDRLKKLGISYVLMMPKIDLLPEESRYKNQMRGEVSWSRYFQSENGKVNLYEAFTRGTRDNLIADSVAKTGERIGKMIDPAELYTLAAARGSLKAWRDQIMRDLAEKGKMAEAHSYTRFIDEAAGGLSPAGTVPSGEVMAEWERNIHRFIAGIRRLQTENQITEANLAGLFEPSLIQAAAPGPAAFEPGGYLQDYLLPSVPVNRSPGPRRVNDILPLLPKVSRFGAGARSELRAVAALVTREIMPELLGRESLQEDEAKMAYDSMVEISERYLGGLIKQGVEEESQKIFLRRFLEYMRYQSSSFSEFIRRLGMIRDVADQIDKRISTSNPEVNEKIISEFMRAQSSIWPFIQRENSRGYGEPSDTSYRDYFAFVLRSWDKTRGEDTAAYAENGRVIFHHAVNFAKIGKIRIEELRAAGWDELETFLKQSRITFGGESFKRGSVEVTTEGVGEEFVEGKNPIFRMSLAGAQGQAAKNILIKMNVKIPEFDEIVTQSALAAGDLKSYRVERFPPAQKSDDAPGPASPLLLIEYVPSQIIFASAVGPMGKPLVYSNLKPLNELDPPRQYKALRDLGAHLALDYLLGARDSIMKHFLFTPEGRFFRIDHEYLFQYQSQSRQRLPGALEFQSDFWDFVQALKTGKPLQGWEEEKALREGFDAMLRKFNFNEEGFREKLHQIVALQKLPENKFPKGEIQERMAERATHSYEMLRGIADYERRKHSEARSELRAGEDGRGGASESPYSVERFEFDEHHAERYEPDIESILALRKASFTKSYSADDDYSDRIRDSEDGQSPDMFFVVRNPESARKNIIAVSLVRKTANEIRLEEAYVASAFRRRGIGTLMKTKVVEILRKKYPARRIVAFDASVDGTTGRILEKLGFVNEETHLWVLTPNANRSELRQEEAASLLDFFMPGSTKRPSSSEMIELCRMILGDPEGFIEMIQNGWTERKKSMGRASEDEEDQTRAAIAQTEILVNFLAQRNRELPQGKKVLALMLGKGEGRESFVAQFLDHLKSRGQPVSLIVRRGEESRLVAQAVSREGLHSLLDITPLGIKALSQGIPESLGSNQSDVPVAFLDLRDAEESAPKMDETLIGLALDNGATPLAPDIVFHNSLLYITILLITPEMIQSEAYQKAIADRLGRIPLNVRADAQKLKKEVKQIKADTLRELLVQQLQVIGYDETMFSDSGAAFLTLAGGAIARAIEDIQARTAAAVSA